MNTTLTPVTDDGSWCCDIGGWACRIRPLHPAYANGVQDRFKVTAIKGSRMISEVIEGTALATWAPTFHPLTTRTKETS